MWCHQCHVVPLNRLQMFHILEHVGVGGKSLFVDGFNVAEKLRVQDPESFKVLSTAPLPTRYLDSKEGVALRPLLYKPMIVTAKDETEGLPAGSLAQIRFNNDDRAPLSNLAPETVPKFYKVNFLLCFFLSFFSTKRNCCLCCRPLTPSTRS